MKSTLLGTIALSSILSTTAFASTTNSNIVYGDDIIKLSIGEKPAIRGDLGTMKFQLQAAVKIDPQWGFSAFTRRVTWGASVLMCVWRWFL